jgi:hypothetical protein
MVARFEVLGLQKGELHKLLPTLPLRHLPLTLDIGRRVRQAAGILLNQFLGPRLLRKPALKEGDLSDKAFGILASKG